MKKNSDRPERPEERQPSRVAISTSGATIACSRIAEDDRDHEQRDGDDHAQVALGGLVEVLLHGAAGAEQRARCRAIARAATSTRCERRVGERVVAEDDVDAREPTVVRRDRLARPTPRRARPASRAPRTSVGARPARARSRSSAPARRPGTRAAITSKPVDALDLGLEEPADAVVLLVGQQAEREDGEHRRRSRRARARAAAARGRRRAARRPRCASSASSGPVLDGAAHRPEARGAPAIVSSAGSSVTPASSTQATPIADTGPSPLVEPAVGQQQDEHRGDHGRAAGAAAPARRGAARAPSPRACPRSRCSSSR